MVWNDFLNAVLAKESCPRWVFLVFICNVSCNTAPGLCNHSSPPWNMKKKNIHHVMYLYDMHLQNHLISSTSHSYKTFSFSLFKTKDDLITSRAPCESIMSRCTVLVLLVQHTLYYLGAKKSGFHSWRKWVYFSLRYNTQKTCEI